MNFNVDIEEEKAQRAKYFGETQEDIEGKLISYKETFSGETCAERIAELWSTIRDDEGAITYLAEIYAERTGMRVRSIQEDGVTLVRGIAKALVFKCRGLPFEIYDRFARRPHCEPETRERGVEDMLLLESL